MSATERIEILAIGEPGCYITMGHVPFDAFMHAVEMSPDVVWDDGEGLEPPRHSWMTRRWNKDYEQDWYREVLPGTPGAFAVTLVACEGEWKGPTP